jgi:peptide deformylase
MSSEERKSAMKEIRESSWFGLVTEKGIEPIIKVSPHSTFGLGL